MVTRWRGSSSGMKRKTRRGGAKEPSLLDLGPPSRTTSTITVINQLFECLNAITNQLQSTVELSSSLQALHTDAQNMISTLESQVTLLESFVRASQEQECPATASTYPRLRRLSLYLFLAITRKYFMGIVGGGWACSPSPQCSSADSNHPWRSQKRTSSNRARGRSNLLTVELRNRVVLLRNTLLSDDHVPIRS